MNDIISKTPNPTSGNSFFLKEVAEAIIVSLLIVLPIRYFIVQPFFVKGSSMEPNFKDGQYLIIDEISYRLNDPQRGEVVVFKYPLDPSQFYIKRIIGLPNERVNIKNNAITLFNQDNPNGLVLNESYLLPSIFTNGEVDIKLSTNEYFVMGDNRTASFDSRRWGALPQKNIIGKTYLRAWPIASAQIIPTPSY